MSIINRIVELLKRKGASQADICNYIGIKYNVFTTWKTRGTDPPAKYLVQICDFLNITLEYLFTGQEKNSLSSKLTDEEQEMLELFHALSHDNKIRIKERAVVLAELEANFKPVVKEETEEQETIFIEFATLKASAGTGEQLTDDPERDFIEVVKSDMTLQAKFAIQIHGDSMEPEYSNGDIVLVKAQPQINIGQIGIFTVNDMGYIKKLGTDRLISINSEYDDIYFEEGQEIRCKGLVIGTLEEDDFV